MSVSNMTEIGLMNAMTFQEISITDHGNGAVKMQDMLNKNVMIKEGDDSTG